MNVPDIQPGQGAACKAAAIDPPYRRAFTGRGEYFAEMQARIKETEPEAAGIISMVCDAAGCTKDRVLGHSRQWPLVTVRAIIVYELVWLGWSLSAIGRYLNRTEPTILAVYNRYLKYQSVRDSQFEYIKTRYEQLIQSL